MENWSRKSSLETAVAFKRLACALPNFVVIFIDDMG